MRRSGSQRLWTMLSLLPIIALVAVLVYGYVIRPRMRGPGAGRGPGRTAAEERWIGEARKVGPSLLDLLSEEQRQEILKAEAKYAADVKELPQSLGKQVERVMRVVPNTGGRRAVSGKIVYEPSGMPGQATEVSIRGEFMLQGERGQPGPGLSFNFPTSPEPLDRKRLESRPQIMKRTAMVFLAQNIALEEFEPLWEAALGKVLPIAGPLKKEPQGNGMAMRGEGDLAPADRAAVLAYADHVLSALSKPPRAQGLAFKEPREVSCSAYQIPFAPEAPPDSVGVSGIFSLPEGVPPAGHLEYRCDAVRGVVMIRWDRWDPSKEGIGFAVLTMRFG